MLDAAYERVRSCMKTEDQEYVATRYPQILDGFNYEALDHCLRQYIWAELDHKTPGVRGLGRVSTDTPRFAAYYRTQVGRLDANEQAFLYHAIQDIILTSYMTYALLADAPISLRTYATGDDLFRRWLPLVYSSAGRPKPGVLETLGVVTEGDYERLLQFMQDRHMEIDQMTGKILYYYCVAGVNLRRVENA
ncbi:MAG: hypothetical protein ACYC5I_02025 [Coriobacteriia bacterium]